MMRYDQQIEEMSKQLLDKTGGMFMVMPCVPTALFPVVPMSLWHYWGLTQLEQKKC